MSNNSSNHHHDNDDLQNSPSHIAMTGHDFSPEDIQDLLGGVLDAEHHHQHPGASHSNSDHQGEATDNMTHVTTTTSACSGTTEGVGIPEDSKTAARTERKRSREKQRRSDVNRQFAELTTTLRRIEGEAAEVGLQTGFSAPSSNRAELIARTVTLLNSLHDMSKKRKQEISNLETQLDAAKKAGEETAAKLKESLMAPQNLGGNKVMMMVPMMISSDGSSSGLAGGGGMMQPWIPQYGMPTPMMPDTQQQKQQQSSTETAAAAVPAAPWMMPWGMPPPAMMMQAPMVPPPASTMGNNESKIPSSDGSSATIGSNLAHCA